VTAALTAQNAATPYLNCTLAANSGRCSSAIGWRATPALDQGA
jgi:hypothetical protein